MWSKIKDVSRELRERKQATALQEMQVLQACLQMDDAEALLSRRRILAECGSWRGVPHSCTALLLTTTARSAATKATRVLTKE